MKHKYLLNINFSFEIGLMKRQYRRNLGFAFEILTIKLEKHFLAILDYSTTNNIRRILYFGISG